MKHAREQRTHGRAACPRALAVRAPCPGRPRAQRSGGPQEEWEGSSTRSRDGWACRISDDQAGTPRARRRRPFPSDRSLLQKQDKGKDVLRNATNRETLSCSFRSCYFPRLASNVCQMRVTVTEKRKMLPFRPASSASRRRRKLAERAAAGKGREDGRASSARQSAPARKPRKADRAVGGFCTWLGCSSV